MSPFLRYFFLSFSDNFLWISDTGIKTTRQSKLKAVSNKKKAVKWETYRTISNAAIKRKLEITQHRNGVFVFYPPANDRNGIYATVNTAVSGSIRKSNPIAVKVAMLKRVSNICVIPHLHTTSWSELMILILDSHAVIRLDASSNIPCTFFLR